MVEKDLYALLIISVILCGALILVFIIQFSLIISNRNFVRKRDEANQKRYEELSEQINGTQNLFKNQVIELLDSVRKMIK